MRGEAMKKLRIAMSQMNSAVGDIEGNTAKIINDIRRAREKQADIVVFPELAVCGYPPEDLLLKKEFIKKNGESMERITKESYDITAIVGFVDAGEDIYNAAAIAHNGSLGGVVHKFFLPNYGVFDENRYFQAGTDYRVFACGDVTFGVVVCEDIWYAEGPAQVQALLGDAQLIISINASPFYNGKWRVRERILGTRAFDGSFYLIYVNSIGGQDELIFDGHSLVFSPSGDLVTRAPLLEEALLFCDIDISEVFRSRLIDPRRRKAKLELKGRGETCQNIRLAPIWGEQKEAIEVRSVDPPEDSEEIFKSLVLGISDYVHKNGFNDVVLGLSGGIDSAMTAVLAVNALGREHVKSVYMPSRFSSKESDEDARKCAENLGIELLEIPIQETYESFKTMLAGAFKGQKEDVTEENIQARVRGTILMALSNKFGWLVLTTGNKSEIACGYCTLYGDMVGGFGALKDVSKMQVYALAAYANRTKEVIPLRVIQKAPSAELRPDQKDTDSLPPYDLLDALLHLYVEKEMSVDDIVNLGYKRDLVSSIIRLVDRNEYKRRQAPPGIKISEKAFGKDRRLPITNLFKSWK
jgi:NAD+ synthase (glutamine-hydrolysing)